jgi:uncharacterized protein YcaQ
MSAASPPAYRITPHQARLLHLHAQGLAQVPRRRARKPDLAAAIAHMQLLQIDTIHVVARSPYLVLYSRLGAFCPEWLTELLAERVIFECWAHEACFAPLADYPLHRAHALADRSHWARKHAHGRKVAHESEMTSLLRHIGERGAVKAADFERRDGAGGWWGWKSEKRWLEAWFALGELMIARRERFQRVYDLRERVLVGTAFERFDDATLPDAATLRREFLLRGLRALGIAQARWIADYFRVRPGYRDAELEPMLASGELLPVVVEGWSRPAYVHRDHTALLDAARRGRLRSNRTTLLSPFDPVVWDRARALEMFGFDYRIECYTPAPKRRYGYFALPILHRGCLIGRLDAKAHRAAGVFELKSVHFEAQVRPNAAALDAVAGAIIDCARWHETPRVRVGRVDPGTLRRELQRRFASPRLQR